MLNSNHHRSINTVNNSPSLFVSHFPPPRRRQTTMSNDAVPLQIIDPNPNQREKKAKKPDPDPAPPQPCSSCCSSTSSSGSKGVRVGRKNRVAVSLGRRNRNDAVEALALPLGMSIAAFVAQVLEKKDEAGGRMSVDHLSEICTLAVRESLVNVFGDQFDCFLNNFEKSFQSTLMTLRLISESSQKKLGQANDFYQGRSSEAIVDEVQEGVSTFEERVGNMRTNLPNTDLALHDGQSRQLACLPANTLYSGINQSMVSNLEKSVREQARSNDLKTVEIGLLMKKIELEEDKLALSCNSNSLEWLKLSVGISKSSFKLEKFKTQLEDSRHAELLRKCVDCLVAGLLIMLASLSYGTYIYSHQRITEATASCITPMKEPGSWWMPKQMTSFNSGLQVLRCQVQVLSRMLFGVLMMLAVAYLLIQRSATSPNQTMPITFMLLLLAFACGLAGKFCVDTLGGSGNHWLFYWEVMCLLHFFSNVCSSALFFILHGPVAMKDELSRQVSRRLFIPYWIRRVLFYGTMLLVLPLLCGFMPFAGPSEWSEHFSSLVAGYISPVKDEL